MVALVASVAVFPDTGAALPLNPVRTPITGIYVVRSGDSLLGIARNLKVTVSDLLALNELTLASLIYPGMRLQIPGAFSSASAIPATPGRQYMVRSGDSLFGIALNLHVSVRDLMDTSKLRLDSVIYPGMRIRVPDTATLPQSTTPTSNTSAPLLVDGTLTYVIRPGDHLSGIAARSGVTIRQLLASNNLSISSVVHPGRTLVLPAGALLPPAAITAPTVTRPAANASRVDTVVNFALQQVGKPYKFFTAGPDTFDCSGLTKAAYAQVGVALTHQSAAQSTAGVAVDWTTEPILPGDLVFMYSSNNTDVISHVGMAISSSSWIQAPRSHDVVRVGAMPAPSRILAVRRIIQP